MTRKILFLTYILFVSYFVNAQIYQVNSYSKINELNGNLNIVLNDEDWFGYAVEGIGDLNQDGVLDVAVSSLQDDDGGFNRGAIYILFLNQNGTVISSQKIADNTGGFNGDLDDWDIFGTSISLLGDLNNDGKVEIAVGAEYDGDGGYRHGAIWILSLNTDGTVQSHIKISGTQGGFLGNLDDWDVFGTDVETVGDLDGDGFTDIAVGARRDGDGANETGAVWILFLNNDFTVKSHQKISATFGGLPPQLQTGDYFGSAIANLGDLNNDGVIDLAVGAYRDDDNGIDKGAIYIIFLNADGTVFQSQKISETSGGFTDNLNINSRFGKSIDFVGDINGDGKKEILVGSSGYDNFSTSPNEGSFYFLNLNTNGTVDSYEKYGNGLNNFNGVLNSNDFFGFSVSYIGQLNCKPSLVIGAFRDSENGYQKGAAWILNLGKVNYYVNSTDPSTCIISDGSITITGLNSNSDYTITYNKDGIAVVANDNSGLNGEITFTGLPTGTYDTIVVTEDTTGCSNNLGDIDLSAPVLAANIIKTDPSTCIISDGSITITGLNSNSDYTITYNKDGITVVANDNSGLNGEITLTGLSTGIYDAIIVTEDTTGCMGNLGQLELLAPDLTINIFKTDPTLCGNDDGIITITGLIINTDYIVTYNKDGLTIVVNVNSGSNGEIRLEDLQIGDYENITIEDVTLGCIKVVGNLSLVNPSMSEMYGVVLPTGCNVNDGKIIISDLVVGIDYVVEYYYNSNLVTTVYTADNNGEITITDLLSGVYEYIMVIGGPIPCSGGIGQLDLTYVGLNININSINPTICGVNDGALFFSNLNANEPYNISFYYNSILTTLNEIADSNGEIVISNLNEGNYTNILVEEVSTLCTYDFGTIVLIAPDLGYQLVSSNPSYCGISNGLILLSNLNPNETYSISYYYNSIQVILNEVADSNGEVRINSLREGDYTNINVENVSTLCSDSLGDITLSFPSFEPVITVTEPTNCGFNDGQFIISNLFPETEYFFTYTLNSSVYSNSYVSDSNGEIRIVNLSEGLYEGFSIFDNQQNCFINLSEIEVGCVKLEIKCFKTKKFFTPNNDGINDFWSLADVKCDYTLFLYDRYGKLLKTLTPENEKWDGTYNGKNMPSTDYWYQVNFIKEGKELVFKSHFALKR